MAKQTSCHSCVYAHWDAGLWVRTLGTGWPSWPTCGNQPESPGRMKECPRGGVCRNYRVKPPVPKGDGVKTIPLGDGVYAYVDAADYEWLNQWHWRVHGGYAARYETQWEKQGGLHASRDLPSRRRAGSWTMSMATSSTIPGLICGISRDRRTCTTRKSTPAPAPCSRASLTTRRVVTGVRSVDLGKKCFYLGQFDSEVEAARAYDCKAVEVFGEFARPNFPDEWPAKRRQEVHAKWLREQAKQKGKARELGSVKCDV